LANATCPLCNSDQHQYCFSERGHDLLECDVCDLFYIHPYPDDVRGRVAEYDYVDLRLVSPDQHYRSEMVYQQAHFKQLSDALHGARSVLDVGCGTGHLLELLAKDRQLYRAGVELNKDRAAFAKKTAQCEVFQIPIEEFEPQRKFDAIIMTDVLSHIPNFERLFKSVSRLLSPDGRFILRTGEMAKHVRKSDLFDWGIPDHLHFLGLRTLDHICRQFGFRILEHTRAPLSKELFSPTYFRQPGRSKLRNILKAVLLHTPLALNALAAAYDLRSGQRVYSSFIVLGNSLNRAARS